LAGLFLGNENWWGGGKQIFGGGVNMCESQIYIKNIKKTETNTLILGGRGSGVLSQLRGPYLP